MHPLGLTTYDAKQAYHGYTLFTPMTGTATYLIDMQGSIVHRWALPGCPGTYGHLLDNGNLLINIRTGNEPLKFGGRGERIVELDWDDALVWEYADVSLHHDFCRLPNGHTMVLGWERVPDVIAAQVQGGLPDTEHEQGMWGDYFREVTPDHRVVWEWHGYQHLEANTDVIAPLHQRQEWTHANTCEVLPDGNLLTSFRAINTIGIIDRQTDDFVWKWGAAQLGGQHDPNPLPNGQILLFDNGWHTRRVAPFPGSRVIEVDPQTDEIGWTYETKPSWAFFSSFISGAQRLDNGNTLICEGMHGRIFEVTPTGEMVWQFVNPFFGYDERWGNVNTVFRAYRYSPDFPGFQAKLLRPEAHAWLSHLYASH
ncbi:MAG: aryl-sulfate sulfotransferase [bacterium]|nr:aryl-sulfate sulfotransferase [bacterium]